MQDERIIVIDINLNRGLVVLLALALLMATLVGYLAWGQREAAASSPQAPLDHARNKPLASSAGLRQYYLTKSRYLPTEALDACASGYHMASLWEILDPSNLKYNPTLGYTRDDSGQGPPTAWGGWVRTGYSSSTSSTEGWGNCSAWTSNDSGHRGTYVSFSRDWNVGGEFHIWNAGTYACSTDYPAWCVED
jgi:hypothetical protein